MPGISIRELEREEPSLSFYWRPDLGSFPEFNGIRLKAHWFLGCELPSPSFEAQQIYAGGMRRSFGGSTDALTFTLNMLLTDGYDLLLWAQGWREKIRDSRGYYGLPKDYQHNLRFKLQDTTGATKATALLTNCWPISPQSPQLDYRQSQPNEVSLNFSCDEMQIALTSGPQR